MPSTTTVHFAQEITFSVDDGCVVSAVEGPDWTNASNIDSGTLAVAYGGTGANSLTGVLVGNGTDPISTVDPPPTTGQVLTATSPTTFAWETPSSGGGNSPVILYQSSSVVEVDGNNTNQPLTELIDIPGDTCVNDGDKLVFKASGLGWGPQFYRFIVVFDPPGGPFEIGDSGEFETYQVQSNAIDTPFYWNVEVTISKYDIADFYLLGTAKTSCYSYTNLNSTIETGFRSFDSTNWSSDSTFRLYVKSNTNPITCYSSSLELHSKP
jgi:hypothetical protein